MPIQFRCTGCGRLLRTGDDTAGRQAQCPACGAVTAIPGALAAVPSSGGEAPSAPSAEADLPPPPALPESQAVAPVFQTADLRTFAASRVAGPAIALIVVGTLTIALQVMAIALISLQIGFAGAAAKQADIFPMFFTAPVQIVISTISMLRAIVITIGGIQMMRLKNYGLSMTTAIVSIIPCFGLCCLLEIPIGIWALVTLSDNTVRIGFRNGAR